MPVSPFARVWYVFWTATAFAALSLGCIWLYTHWNEPDLQGIVVNFVVAWIPLVLSILIAFVPDLRRAHISWRAAIVAIGFIWSIFLWKQQYIALQTSRHDQEQAISKAVEKSNQHSDQKIGEVQQDLAVAKSDLGGRIDKLPNLISKSESDLTASISKVGTARPNYAQLQFSLFATTTDQMPLLTESLDSGENGTLTVDFVVTNTSDSAATSGDLWVQICDECVFVKEPQGFDKPAGTTETIRHKSFPGLNPGVTLEKMTIDFKMMKRFNSVDVSFRYSCATCGKLKTAQTAKILVLPPFSRPIKLLPPAPSN